MVLLTFLYICIEAKKHFMRVYFSLLLISLSFGVSATIQEEINAIHQCAYSLLDNDKPVAIELGERAEKLAHDSGLVFEEANSLFIQAWVLNLYGKPGESFLKYLKAISLCEEKLDHPESLRLYLQLIGNIGLNLKDLQAFKEASLFFNRGIEIARQKHLHKEFLELSTYKSMMLRDMKHLEEAHYSITNALELSTKITTERLNALNVKGFIEIDLGLYDLANNTYNEILAVKNPDLNKAYHNGFVWHNLGYSFFKQGLYEQAVSSLLKAEDLRISSTDASRKFLTWRDLSEVYFELKKLDSTLLYAEKARNIYLNVGLMPAHFRIFTTLSKSYAALGNYQEAHKYAEMYMAENEKYLKTQEMLMKVREEFHMEELTARFFMSIDDVQDKSLYWIILSIISSSFTIILLAGMTKNHLAKRALKKSLQEISRDSW